MVHKLQNHFQRLEASFDTILPFFQTRLGEARHNEILELITNHGEYEVALSILCDDIIMKEIKISQATYNTISELVEAMEVTDSYQQVLTSLLNLVEA